MKKFLYPKIFLSAALVFHMVYFEVSAYGGVHSMARLQRELFKNYSADIRPCLNYSRPTHVQAKFYIASVMSLDIKNQVLKFSGFISLEWKDELLIWNPEDYGGIKDMVRPQKTIWKPDIAVYNAIEKVYLGDDEVLVEINSDGTIRWEPVTNMEVSCKVDISKYPFDETTCTINLTSWMSDMSSVNLSAKDPPIDMSNIVVNGQYWVTSGGVTRRILNYDGTGYIYLGFDLKLKRRPAYLAITLLMPVSLLAVLSVVSFFLSPEEPEKVSLSITILLSFTVFLGVIDNDLPESSDDLSLLVVYVGCLLLLSFLSVGGNATVLVLYRRELVLKMKRHHRKTHRARPSHVGLPYCYHKNSLPVPAILEIDDKSEKIVHIFKYEKAKYGKTVCCTYKMDSRRLNNYFFGANILVLIVLLSVISFFMWK